MQLPENLTGLAPKAQAQTAMPAQGGLSPDETYSDENGLPLEAASAQEQAAYEEFMIQAGGMLAGGKSNKKIMQAIRSARDPGRGVAAATAAIVTRVAAAAKQSGTELGTDLLIHATQEVAGLAMEMAESKGIGSFSDNPDLAQGVAMRAGIEAGAKLVDAGILSRDEMTSEFQAFKDKAEDPSMKPLFEDFAARAGAEDQTGAQPENAGQGADQQPPPDEASQPLSRNQRRRRNRKARAQQGAAQA
ncbi:MAG: hypothetical protein AAF416_14330 [Pseudomonadota bacterium]